MTAEQSRGVGRGGKHKTCRKRHMHVFIEKGHTPSDAWEEAGCGVKRAGSLSLFPTSQTNGNVLLQWTKNISIVIILECSQQNVTSLKHRKAPYFFVISAS